MLHLPHVHSSCIPKQGAALIGALKEQLFSVLLMLSASITKTTPVEYHLRSCNHRHPIQWLAARLHAAAVTSARSAAATVTQQQTDSRSWRLPVILQQAQGPRSGGAAAIAVVGSAAGTGQQHVWGTIGGMRYDAIADDLEYVDGEQVRSHNCPCGAPFTMLLPCLNLPHLISRNTTKQCRACCKLHDLSQKLMRRQTAVDCVSR